DEIVAGAAFHRVVSIPPAQEDVAGAGIDRVDARPARAEVAGGTTGDEGGRRRGDGFLLFTRKLGEEVVLSGGPVEAVTAAFAEEGIVALPAGRDVVSCPEADLPIVAVACVERVCARSA